MCREATGQDACQARDCIGAAFCRLCHFEGGIAGQDEVQELHRSAGKPLLELHISNDSVWVQKCLLEVVLHTVEEMPDKSVCSGQSNLFHVKPPATDQTDENWSKTLAL